MERQKKWNEKTLFMIKWLSYHAKYKSNINFNIPTGHPYLVMSDTCIETDEAEKQSNDNRKDGKQQKLLTENNTKRSLEFTTDTRL